MKPSAFMASRRPLSFGSLGCAALAAAALLPAFPAIAARHAAPAVRQVACKAVVRDIVDLGPGRDRSKRSYAVEFDALSERSAVVSGTVALFSADGRYDVAFAGAVARGTGDRGAPTTVVVRVPSAVRIERGYVATLASTQSECLPLTREVRPSPVGPKVPAWFGAILERSQDAHQIDAPPPRKQRGAQCDVQDRHASAKRIAPPEEPSDIAPQSQSAAASLDVPVVVVLSDDGSVLDARPARRSQWPQLDAAAVDAARRSAFVPQVVRCRPEGGEYLLVVTYARPG